MVYNLLYLDSHQNTLIRTYFKKRLIHQINRLN